MKKFFVLTMLLFCGMSVALAQKPAEIKFDKLTHDFGTFSEKEPVVSCTFSFTNVGESPLIINQAVASCGCTVPEYTKTPIQPGEKGEIKVTYNGTGKFPGHFKKSITVRTNGAVEMTRLYIEGEMTEAKEKKNPCRLAGVFYLELIGEAYRTIFLELPVTEFAIPDAGIVETREEEQISSDILRHTEFEGILPLYLCTFV